MNIHPKESRCFAGRGFTLVEVMISVVLVLIVVFGVSQVFTMSSQTVGAGAALSNMTRDNRAAQTTMADDFRSVAADTPVFIIVNEVAYYRENVTDPVKGVETAQGSNNREIRGRRAGFFNKRAHDADADGDPFTYDGNGDGDETDLPDDLLSLLQGSDRNPRLDRLAFFARGRYSKQTEPPPGDRRPGTPAPTASEAFVWYGHLMLDQGPGLPPLTPNNQFAEQRILGRACILLRDDLPATSKEVFTTDTPGSPDDKAPRPKIPPFYPTNPYNDIRSSRNDLVPLSINTIRERLNKRYVDPNPPQSPDRLWYQPFWDVVQGDGVVPYRFVGQPKITRKPLGTTLDPAALVAEISQTNTTFLTNCTQFIVEYAGDYLYQDPKTGALVKSPGNAEGAKEYLKEGASGVQHGETDGEVDYVIDQGIIDPMTGQPAKRIRWYGMPRDVTGPQPDKDGKLVTRIDIDDVVPLSYMLTYQNNDTPKRFTKYDAIGQPRRVIVPWELGFYPYENDYMNVLHKNGNSPNLKSSDYVKYGTIFREGQIPRMLRITMKLDDPGQRLQEGQWIQYVLTR